MSDELIPMGNEFYLFFRHYRRNEMHSGTRSGTLCQIFSGRQLIGQGTSVVHPGEPYNAAIGRQLAMWRALQQSYPDSAEAAPFWSAYYENFGHTEYQVFQDFLAGLS